jgi:electron transfer flavoprotein beta subunit
MKILVAVKRVVDFNVHIRVKPDGSGVVTDNVKMGSNPFDEIAVEEAVRLKEAGVATEVVAVTIGPQAAQDVLRNAIAMGADRAILVRSDEALEPLAVAKVLASIAGDEKPDLFLLGKQAIDDDCGQAGQMLAGLLGWGQGTFAQKLAIEDGAAEVTREVDGGLQLVSLPLPAVVTADLRLNEPRFVTLPSVMRAKSKPLATIELASLGIDTAPRFTVVEVTTPAERGGGRIVGNAKELVAQLHAAQVI